MKLWHKRLGHMSKKGLQILARKNHLPNGKGQLLESCTNCLVGKHVEYHFRNQTNPR